VTEIVAGFKLAADDITTTCPRCSCHMKATFLVDHKAGVEHFFMGLNQTLARLPGKETMDVDDIRKGFPDVFFSALFHWGSLLNAFTRKHKDYRREKVDFEAKAEFCLGQMPDHDVSAIFGLKEAEVTAMRRKRHIKFWPFQGSIIPAKRKIRLVPATGSDSDRCGEKPGKE
jgi:hypothetical protein